MIPEKLLRVLHQARFVYVNESFREIYIWYGTNFIKIFNYVGKEIGTSNIINYGENREYKQFEQINIRDVTLSIDDIVHSNFKSNE